MCLGGALSGCPLKKESADGGAEDAGRGRTDSGAKDAGMTDDEDDADVPEGDSGPKSDAGTDSGAKSDASTDSGIKTDGGTSSSGNMPTLDSAMARQSGRFGADLRIDVTGTDVDGDAVAVRVAVFSATGDAIHLGGDADASGAIQFPLVMALPAAPGSTSYMVLRDLFAANSGLDHVEVELVDATGLSSSKVTASVSSQPVLNNGALCDATYVANRCADGFGCKGTVPTVCMAGEAPKLTRVSYLADDLGTRILVEGTDADLDARRYALDFLDANNNPVMIDTDSDPGNVPDASSFEGPLEGRLIPIWDGAKFFVRIDQGETFAETVAKVRVKIIDRGGLISEPIVVTKATTPVRSAGQTCDARLFDRCAAGSVCISANMGKSYSCTAVSASRTKACTAGPTITPVNGTGSVRGSIAAPSLWDAPAGCVGGSDPTNQPEALVKVVLANKANKLTLSTNNLYTSFDSALYMMSKCDDVPVLAWCEDQALDKVSIGAELVLMDVAAGTYYVVIDSFNSSLSGTTFQLDVNVE